MRAQSTVLPELLAGSFTYQFTADVYYNDARVLADVPVSDAQFTWDSTRTIEGSGTCTITITPTHGWSLSPKDYSDVLAPFGAELAVYVSVSAGCTAERVPIGWFRITDIPATRDETLPFQGDVVTAVSVTEVVLEDRFITIARNEFVAPTVPSQLGSLYEELATLTGLQITRTIPDRPISRSVVYSQDRLEACYDLAEIADATPYMRSDGTLSLRKRSPGPPIDKANPVGITRSMSSQNVPNVIIVTGQADTGEELVGVAERTSGRLRARNPDGTRSPHHRVVSRYHSPFLSTQLAVDKEAIRRLSAEKRQAVKMRVSEPFNPLREIGDVLTVTDGTGHTTTGRISRLTIGDIPVVTYELEVLS